MSSPFPDAGEIRFRKHRDAGSVLNATLVFVRENARELLTSYLAIVAPIAAVSGLASVLFVSRAGDVFTDPQAILNDPFAVFGPSYFASAVLGLLTAVVAQAAAGGYVRLYRRGEAGSVTPGVLWDETRELVLPLLGLTLAVSAGVVVTALVNVVPCLGTLAWLGFLVWVFPVVSVMVAVRVLEAPSLGEAWERARALVKGSWGFAVGALLLAVLVLVLLSVVVGVLTGLVGIVLGVGAGFDPLRAPAGVTTATAVVQAVVGVLSYVVYLVPFLAAYFVHGRLAEELDGTTLGDDLDVFSEAAFDAPARPAEGRSAEVGSAEGQAPAPETPFGNRLGQRPAALPGAPPPLSSTPPVAGGDGDRADGDQTRDETDDRDERSGFRGGGFDA